MKLAFVPQLLQNLNASYTYSFFQVLSMTVSQLKDLF